MPKKASKYVHVREPMSASGATAATTVAVVAEKTKRHRSVHIGPRNNRRWLSLKKRLGLTTDDDLVVYLLDLADSIIARKDENCLENSEPWKMHLQGKEMLDVTTTTTPMHNVFQVELPRRSLRKLAASEESVKTEKYEKIEKLSSFQNSLDKVSQQDSKSYSKSCSRTSKTKRHKNKGRHHKEKRKKRKHQKIKELKDLVNIENRILSSASWEFNAETNTENRSLDLQDNYISQSVSTKSLKDLHSLNPAKIIELSHDISQDDYLDIKKTDISTNKTGADTVQNHNAESLEAHIYNDVNSKFSMNSSKFNQHSNTHSEKILISHQEEENEIILNRESLSKQIKHTKHEFTESPNALLNIKTGSCDELILPVNKRDKKRHKEVEHQSKKHRDVRKAPHDGIISSNNFKPLIAAATTTTGVPDSKSLPSEAMIDNIESETPRLAIKIKLCQECNSRHLQDACPLKEPEYTIKDSISLEQWIKKHNKNAEAVKAFNSNDPMSQGYSKHVYDGFESDEELEQHKSKIKVESEEKQQNIDANRPLYSRDSLPDCLELKLSNVDHGLGVFVKSPVPMYTQLGPLIGKPVQEMDIPDDFPMRHIWEIDINNKTLYVSTTNPLTSNWIRYVRPAETKDDRNVAVIIKNGELFLVTSKSLIAGTEITYWSDSQSTAWARKNKTDKTNCGGCNLNFAHPIYYRLHCCIFHDTNYSLTIRKYHCKVCGAAVLGKDNIMKHAAQLHAGRGAYQCQYCKKFFLRLNYLEMHRTYGCSQNPQRSRPLCDFCGRKFCQPQKLKVHIKRMHSDMSEVLREFQCKMCLKLLGSRAALQRHMKEVHHKDVVGAATCDRCGKMFQNKSNLKIHMLTHSGVKPFKCKETGCKAAFTTKQCLQFHYKKVHGLSEEMMPKIERSVAYTFDAYSGGLVEDVGRGKTPKFNTNDIQENNDSLASYDDCSSEHNNMSSLVELPCSNNLNTYSKINDESSPQEIPRPATAAVDSALESAESDIDLCGKSQLSSRDSKKWMVEFNSASSETLTVTPAGNVYDFEDSRLREEGKEEVKMQSTSQTLINDPKLSMSVYRRTEGASASLLVEAALDAAEREIGTVSSPILEDSDRETNLYSISNDLEFKAATCVQNQSVVQRHESSPDHQNLESYIQDDLTSASPATTPHINPHGSPSHVHVDYHIHRPLDYVNVSTSRTTHSINQYLEQQQDVQRVMHVSQDITSTLSPSRYQDITIPHVHAHSHSHVHAHAHTHVSPGPPVPPTSLPHLLHEPHHHLQASNDTLDSDESDSVVQNLSLPVKEKSLQHLELVKYDTNQTLESEFSVVNRDRVRFESLVIQSTGDQGLDMSARGFQQAFESQVQNNSSHHLHHPPHHHHHHLYEVSERERQGVDLSRTAACMSPPPYHSPYTSSYTHVDVPRVVNLEPNQRSHHLHNSVSRIIASPQAASSLTSHLVSESLEARILSSPSSSMPTYNNTYSVGPTPYNTSRSGYHYSGYY